MDGWTGFTGISDAADQLNYAADMGFTVSGPGVDVLINAVMEMQNVVDDVLANSHMLAQVPALGQTPAALVYKPFMASIASDPVQGFIPFLRRLQRDLADVEASLRKSMAAYENSDQSGASGIAAAGS